MSNRSFRASSAGRKVAQDAFDRLGIKQETFAQRVLIGRATISKFFNGKPIRKDLFIGICAELKLDWKKIAAIEIEESQDIPDAVIESRARTSRQVPTVNADYDVLTRIERFSKPAADWLEHNSERLAVEACEAVIGQDENKTSIEKKLFQSDICYYLALVAQSLREPDSIIYNLSIYRLPEMENFFSLYDISLYLQAFKQIKELVRKRASTELVRESVAELEYQIEELLDYLKRLP